MNSVTTVNLRQRTTTKLHRYVGWWGDTENARCDRVS